MRKGPIVDSFVLVALVGFVLLTFALVFSAIGMSVRAIAKLAHRHAIQRFQTAGRPASAARSSVTHPLTAPARIQRTRPQSSRAAFIRPSNADESHTMAGGIH